MVLVGHGCRGAIDKASQGIRYPRGRERMALGLTSHRPERTGLLSGWNAHRGPRTSAEQVSREQLSSTQGHRLGTPDSPPASSASVAWGSLCFPCLVPRYFLR